MKKQFVHGWNRQEKDERDIQFKYKVMSVPKKLILDQFFPPTFDQLNLGTCASNAGITIMEYVLRKEGISIETFSRLFLYYIVRLLEGTLSQGDCGSTIRGIFKAANKYGVCHEQLYPYIIEHFQHIPEHQCFTDALKQQFLQYQAVDVDVNSVKNCLAQGNPVEIGIDVYESFMSLPKTGKMKKPSGKLLGGHALVIYGYDDSKKAFLVRNSWGDKWGINGDFWYPYKYLTSQYCDDFWTLIKI